MIDRKVKFFISVDKLTLVDWRNLKRNHPRAYYDLKHFLLYYPKDHVSVGYNAEFRPVQTGVRLD